MTSESKDFSNIVIPVSLGELIDKITILEIKKLHMNGIKLKNVDKELLTLQNFTGASLTNVQLALNRISLQIDTIIYEYSNDESFVLIIPIPGSLISW